MCLATSGPGATNLTTGIATAYMDSSPVVFITCNVTQNLIGRDAFQEVDITGIAMPITKSTYLVRDVNSLADIVREAFALARSGRPGPVLIDIAEERHRRRRQSMSTCPARSTPPPAAWPTSFAAPGPAA